jgi:adenylate cyclase class 2
MLEAEVKAPVKDFRNVEKRLMALEARYLGEEEQVDLYFNHPSRDFSSTDEALRLRRAGGKLFITYKGPKLDALTKTRIEHEVGIDNYDEAKRILLSLGFTPVMKVKKNRKLYSCRGYIIALDSVEGLGNYVEVEGRKEEDKDPLGLLAFLQRIGIPPEKSERRSYLELLLDKKG